MTIYLTPLEQYREGVLSAVQALRVLAIDLGETEDEIAKHEIAREAIRDQIAQIVAACGKVEIAGLAQFELTAPSVTKRYDRGKVERLMDQLRDEGYGPIAERIRQCRTESERVGSLRITWEKAR